MHRNRVVGVMRLSINQLYDGDTCKDFVYNLAAHLRMLMQKYTKRFDEMHELLGDLSPDGKPASIPDGKL